MIFQPPGNNVRMVLHLLFGLFGAPSILQILARLFLLSSSVTLFSDHLSLSLISLLILAMEYKSR